jgi:tetratricopeptide (TPR) repeat protein
MSNQDIDNKKSNQGIQGIIHGTVHFVKEHKEMSIRAVLILAVTILLVAVIFNIGTLSPIAHTLWQQIFPPLSPARDDESLIIVADFADKSAGEYDGADPAQYIYRTLTNRVENDELNIRIERLYETLNSNNVRQTGESYNATLVVWGQYDAFGITPYVERIRALQGGRTDEEGQNLLVNQERMQFNVVTDLPAMSSYLVLFILGSDLNTTQQWDQAVVYLTSAINAIPEGDTTANPDEAYFERGLAHSALGDFPAAIADFTAADDAGFGDTALLYYHRGLAHNGAEQFPAAIADFTAADDAGFGDTALLYYHRGLAHNRAEQFPAAIADFTAADDAGFGDTALLYYHRGLAHNGNGDYQEAIADFNQTLDILDVNDQQLRPEAEYWLQEAEANLNAESSNE